jgi:hypothetical protein
MLFPPFLRQVMWHPTGDEGQTLRQNSCRFGGDLTVEAHPFLGISSGIQQSLVLHVDLDHPCFTTVPKSVAALVQREADGVRVFHVKNREFRHYMRPVYRGPRIPERPV